MRTCRICQITSTDFRRRSRTCRQCTNQAARQRRLADPSRWHEYHLRNEYGISLETYTQMSDAQAGTCAICHRPEMRVDHRTGQPRRLQVDHNHSTGEIRGLLCMDCNRFLGLAGDSAERLRSAAAYLSRGL